MPRLFLLHGADFHIGAKTKDKVQGNQQGDPGLLAFQKMVAYAYEHKIPLVTLAGDIFDDIQVAPALEEGFFAAMATAPQTQFFIVPGNHDPYSPHSVWDRYQDRLPAHVTVVGPDFRYKDYIELNVRLYAAAFTQKAASRPLLDRIRPTIRQSYLNLLVLHGDHVVSASQPSDYNPINQTWLNNSEMDLLLLGHVHQARGFCQKGPRNSVYESVLHQAQVLRARQGGLRPEEKAAFQSFDSWEALAGALTTPNLGAWEGQDTPWIYAGFPVSRGFDELGDPGFRLLYLQKQADHFLAYAYQVVLPGPRFLNVSVDVEAWLDAHEEAYGAQIGLMVEYLQGEIEKKAQVEDTIRLNLRGRVDHPIPVGILTPILQKTYPKLSLIDLTQPKVNREVLSKEHSIRGEVLRLTEAFRKDPTDPALAPLLDQLFPSLQGGGQGGGGAHPELTGPGSPLALQKLEWMTEVILTASQGPIDLEALYRQMEGAGETSAPEQEET